MYIYNNFLIGLFGGGIKINVLKQTQTKIENLVFIDLGNWTILLPKKKINRDLTSSWEWKLSNTKKKKMN